MTARQGQYLRDIFTVALTAVLGFILPSFAMAETSLLVLPFKDRSDTGASQYIGDGIADRLIAGFGTNGDLMVFGRQTAFALAADGASVPEIARELGVRYVLQGYVDTIEGSLEISAGLLDVETRETIWQWKFKPHRNDFWSVQNWILAAVERTLGFAPDFDDVQARAGGGTDNTAAYDHFLHGLRSHYLYTNEGRLAARDEFQAALQLDPDYAVAMSLLGFTNVVGVAFGWVSDPVAALEESRTLGQRAMEVNPNSPEGYWLSGTVAMFSGDHATAIRLHEAALDLAPSSPIGLGQMAMVLNWAGRYGEAEKFGRRAIASEPNAAVLMHDMRGRSLAALGHYDEAIEEFDKSLSQDPNYLFSHIGRASAYTKLGDLEAARAAMAQAREIDSGFSLETAAQVLSSHKDVERILQEWGDAGLPATAPGS